MGDVVHATAAVGTDSGDDLISKDAWDQAHAVPTNSIVKNNFGATTDPAVTDDTGDGYEVGSRWINTSSGARFTCVDASSGAAVWLLVAAAAVDPMLAAYGTPDTAFEFETSSLTGLTTFGSPDVIDADTSVPGHLYIQDAQNTAWQFCGAYASTPSPPFTAIVKVADALTWEQYNYIGAFVGEATPGKMFVSCIRNDPPGFGGYHLANPTDSSGLGPSYGISGQGTTGRGYFAIVVNSDTDIDFYVSRNGLVWYKVEVALNMTATVGSVGLTINAGSTGAPRKAAAAFDYLRIWNSALTLPSVVAP